VKRVKIGGGSGGRDGSSRQNSDNTSFIILRKQNIGLILLDGKVGKELG
jgi:hypothetical protein